MKCSEIQYPAFATWEVNTVCNHRCIYCFNYGVLQTTPAPMPADNFTSIADYIIAHKPLAVSISGGEPLIAFAQLAAPLQRLAEAGISLTLYTNATLITEEIAAFLAKHRIRIMVSFPSAVEVEYSRIVCNPSTFEAAINGMKLLKACGANLQPNLVINRINFQSIEKTITYLAQTFSPKTIYVSRTTKPSNANTDYDAIQLTRAEINQTLNRCVRLGEEYGIRMRSCGGFAPCVFDAEATRLTFGKVCDGGINSYTVTENGDVRLCARDDTVYGNIFKNTFSEIRSAMDSWLAQAIPDECAACARRTVCRGGCRMAAGKDHTPPVKLDCDADTSIILPRGHKGMPLNPFRKYTRKELVAVKDITAVRLSHLAGFIYAEETLAAFLLAHKSFSVCRLCLRCGLSYRKAVDIINRMQKNKLLDVRR